MGVDHNDFWEFNPDDLSPFVKAFSIKQKQLDFQLWQQGAYTRLAVASAMSKGNKYPEKPMFNKEVENKDSKAEADQTKQQSLIRRRFMDHVALLNTKFRGGQ